MSEQQVNVGVNNGQSGVLIRYRHADLVAILGIIAISAYLLITAADRWHTFVSFFGLFVMMGVAWIFSNNKFKISITVVSWGVFIQLLLALLILRTNVGMAFFKWLADVMVKLLDFTKAGSCFVFGNLGSLMKDIPGFDSVTAALPSFQAFSYTNLGLFAFTVLPTIIFIASLTAVLYYFQILQFIVKVFAYIMTALMKASGAESLATSANIFIGQTEAPLFVRPYVPMMTNSELLVLMTGGMATIAGGVMVAFIGMLKSHPSLGHLLGGHLIMASVISAPAAIVMAKIMYPETEEPLTAGSVKIHIPVTDANVIDAAARGALEGLHLALNVGGMLIAFIALIAMANYLIGPGLDSMMSMFGSSGFQLSLEKIFGWIFWPFAWLMGVPFKDCNTVAVFLGQKLVLNEFVAYINLAGLMNSISDRAVILTTYALCGFANFSSIAIQLGGIGGIAPQRRHDLAKLGMRAMIGGTIASYMTANIAGMLI